MRLLYSAVVLISALLLQGCVAATVVGTAAAIGTKAATDPRSVGTQVDDEVLELRVSSALSKDEQIRKEARISEIAYQGRVLLIGQSPDRELSARAHQIALGVDGVQEVYNEIRQGTPVSPVIMAGDAWLTTKIRSQLLTSARVKSSSVKVVTENSEVFLLGLVTEQEGRAAADVASRVSGVKRVTTAFSCIR
ncbi:divisome-associated lipoprotein YraP [Escherichia coli O4]|uniref:division/outer membrane stress-associated lipid-binding lipoprotein n=1 Tax=Escherichia coli TaxID=562 RepID=UPI0004506A21|nr:division/outer membrane stress-associated lipid-binding lipoprotein [Escherichia coli]EKK2313839.1 divisome-associated lipoprotein YraP [Escherichia coli O4]EED1399920.1 divisome-associated lipoprotein YraP [Escherichia coli]EER6662820.1 divisome-associated lipoprotein YraP [Escherichia coli]EER9144715.1 divisome-associated lipoprotein YraP [Escherichia coli]EEU2031578.1 divisome-associated lipoprotein YraP [Escherichia coli]